MRSLRACSRALPVLATLAVTLAFWAAASPGAARGYRLLKPGYPWKIPIDVGGGKGIAFLLGVDNRLTAYALDSGSALWSFQMGLGRNDYVYTDLPIVRVGGRRTIFLLDDRGYLHAIDLKTGNVQWRTYDNQKFIYPPLVVNDWVIVVSEEGKIYKLDMATGKGPRNAPDKTLFYTGARVMARPTLIRDASEREPAFVVALTEELPGSRSMLFLDFISGKPDRRFSGRVDGTDLRDRPVSAPLFSTGSYSPRGSSTMRVFVAVRRGNNELIYTKDYSNPQNPFTLFHKISNGYLCEQPVFTTQGYVILPNTSGSLLALRPDGKPLKSIPITRKEGPMSVELIEMPRQAYGVMVVQAVNAFGAYQINFRDPMSSFGPSFPFSVYAWNVVDTQATAQWKNTKSKYVGEPRLPLIMLGDKLVLNSQVAEAAFMAVFSEDKLVEKDRKTPPEPVYWRTSRPGGSEFLSFDTIEGAARMLVGYGELGTYIVDGSGGAPRVVTSFPEMKARLVMSVPGGALIFGESEKDGHFMGLREYDMVRKRVLGRVRKLANGFKDYVFKEKFLAEPVSTRPIIVKDTVYYSTRGGVYKRRLIREAKLENVPVRASSSLTYHKDVLLVGTETSTLQAIDAKTMQKKWSLRVRGQITAAPVVAGDRIFACNNEGVLYVTPFANPHGRRLRSDAVELKLKRTGAVYAPPLVVGKRLYVALVYEQGKTAISQIDITDPDNPRETEWSHSYYGEVREPMVRFKNKLIIPTADRIVMFSLAGSRGPRKTGELSLLDSVASPLRVVGTAVSFICRDGSIYMVETEDPLK